MSEKLNQEKETEDSVEQNTYSIDLKLKELIATIILSIATLLSAWCGYQSNNWQNTERDFLEERYQIMQEESESRLLGYQTRVAHSMLVIKVMENLKQGNTDLYEFFINRTDSVLRNAIEEWLRLDPENNPSAPRNPLMMNSYRLGFDQKSEELRKTSEELRNRAKDANSISGKYLSLTVLSATVLFFAGIASTLNSRKPQIICITIAIIVLLISVGILINLSFV